MVRQKQLRNKGIPANSIEQRLDLSQIIDLLPCYISIQDRDFRILFANRLFRSDFGDAVGKACYTVYKCAHEICPNCPVQKTFRDKRGHVTEESVKLASGKICQILIQTSPMLDDQGEVTGLSLV